MTGLFDTDIGNSSFFGKMDRNLHRFITDVLSHAIVAMKIPVAGPVFSKDNLGANVIPPLAIRSA